MQTNQDIIGDYKIINSDIWIDLLKKIKDKTKIDVLYDYIEYLSIEYNMDKINLLKNLIIYIIRNKKIDIKLLNSLEHAIHNNDNNVDYFVKFVILILLENDLD